MQHSFPRTARLLKPQQFKAVFAASKRVVGRYFVVLYAASPALDGPAQARLGMAIAKKNIRRAVNRNRVRRLIRETFRHASPRLPAVDIVVLARSQTGQAESCVLRKEIEQLLDALRCCASS